MVYNATRVGRCGVATNETQQRSTFKQSLTIRTLLLTYTGIARGSLSFRREQLPLDSHHHTVHLPVSDTKQAWNRPPQPHPRTAQMLLLTHPTTLILLLINLEPATSASATSSHRSKSAADSHRRSLQTVNQPSNRPPQPQPRASTAQILPLTHTTVVESFVTIRGSGVSALTVH